MSNIKKFIITFILTYFVIRVGFRLTGFNPLKDLPSVFGILVDLTVWICVWLFFYWLIPKIWNFGKRKA